MLEVIDINQSERWGDIVRSMHAYDFYQLPAYHRLDTSGQPLLLYYKTSTNAFALPIILRDISGTIYKDMTSVYGYAGPLSQTENLSTADITLFQEALKAYFDANQVVSVFARLHPLFESQANLLIGLGETAGLNQTVAVDLTLPEAAQRRQYARSMKYQINLLRREGLTVHPITNTDKAAIDSFVTMYYDTMQRVGASEMYFFSSDYFYDFLKTIDSCLFLVDYKGEWVSGALCTFCNGIVQYHLGATRSDFLHLSPLKLALEQARIEGMKRRMHWLHLGGGKGGAKTGDSLFQFKSRFSGLRFQFKVWKYVHDAAVYQALSASAPTAGEFFPLYRLNKVFPGKS